MTNLLFLAILFDNIFVKHYNIYVFNTIPFIFILFIENYSFKEDAMLALLLVLVSVFILFSNKVIGVAMLAFTFFWIYLWYPKLKEALKPYEAENIKETDLYQKVVNQINKANLNSFIDQRQLYTYIKQQLKVDNEGLCIFFYPVARIKAKEVLSNILIEINQNNELEDQNQLEFYQRINNQNLRVQIPTSDYFVKKVVAK